MDSKICNLCKLSKPIDHFRLKRKDQKYRVYICRPCESLEHKKYRATPKVRSPIYQTVWNAKRGKAYGCLSVSGLRSLPSDTCYLCGGPFDDGSQVELDHIHPKSKGGKTELVNLAWAHRQCNRMKHDYTLSEFIDKLKHILCHLEGRLSA